ncbi:hypothetical protein KP509_28G054800 [Ceratopteris richardii]|nr:hypothetical protein KP509_28G054800 [Ceratopteris richardii]
MLAEIATITDDPASDASRRSVQNGGNKTASLFSKEGMKGENQDAMLVLEDFADQPGTVFCGVFDGHGPDGHLIARRVRDLLPGKLASCWRIAYDIHPPGTGLLHQGNRSFTANAGGDPKLIMAWKESLISAHKQVDRDLALYYDELDPTFSGTTAVTLVKQGSDLYIGNVGDSRAILGFLTDENSMMALQLTVDLKPNLRKEAERITKLKGRVFSLPHEPSVKRVWLPGIDSPGLAMARSLGDHCLKKFGVISEPTVTYRKLSVRDKFIVLASDGVWDVLTNDEVVEIVASSHRSLAAEAVVEAATSTWNKKRPQSRADDCTAICLFLDDHLASSSSSSTFRVVNEDSGLKKTATSLISLHRMFTAKLKMDKSASCSELELLTVSTSESTEIVSANAGALNKNLSRGKRAGLLFIGDD